MLAWRPKERYNLSDFDFFLINIKYKNMIINLYVIYTLVIIL